MRYELFAWLTFAHVIGDIALQSDWLAQNKGKYYICLAWHSLIWTGCICFTLNWMGLSIPFWEVGFLFVGHMIIDQWKCDATKKFPSWHLYVDQVLHLTQCLIVFIL